MVPLTTAPLGFVLFVARWQRGCLLFQDCGPKVWVLNEALNLHNVKSTSGWAQYVRRGTENVKVAEGNKLLSARENPVNFGLQVDLVLLCGDLIFVFFFVCSIYKTWGAIGRWCTQSWEVLNANQNKPAKILLLSNILLVICPETEFCYNEIKVCLWENKWMLGLFFCHKLLMCMCSGVGGEMNRALDFSGMCLPSNSFISSS